MFNGDITGNLTILVAFVEGIVSFFSPCVLPILPIYLGYLSGGLEEKESRKKTMLFTATFILGIFVALFILHISVVSISSFFNQSSQIFIKIGGILIILLGLIQLGLFKIPILQKTFRIAPNLKKQRMNLVLAFTMGFTFSFSWTPCIGPALASILILASNSSSVFASIGYILAYAVGFSLPFFVISFFAKSATTFLRRHQVAMQVIAKVGAILLIIMGILMFSGHLSTISTTSNTTPSNQSQTNSENDNPLAPNFEMEDQYGNVVKLNDFKGKIVYMNFWGTWCKVCKEELSDVQKLYDKYKNSEEVAVITFVLPNEGGTNIGNKELNIEGIKQFIKDHNITFPVLFDVQGSLFSEFGIRAFPTTFMLDKELRVFGYIQGGIGYDVMENIIQKVRDGKR